MVAELKPNVSPLILEAVSLRAQGLSYGDVARNMGHEDVKTFTSLVRRTCMDELGIPTFYGTAVWLIRERLIDPVELAKGKDLTLLANLSTPDRATFAAFSLNPHTDPKDRVSMRMDRDFGTKKDLNPAILQTGARNMTELLVLNAAYLNTPPDVLMRMQIMIEPKKTPKKKSTPHKERSPKQLALKSEQTKPDKLIGTILNSTQGEMLRLGAEGMTFESTAAKLGFGREGYRGQLSRALKAAGLRNGEGLNRKDSRDVVLAGRLALTNRLMASGEIDPLEIAQKAFSTTDELVEAFSKLTPIETIIVGLLSQAKTPSQILDDLTKIHPDQKNIMQVNKKISLVYRKVQATSMPHLVALAEANKRVLAQS